MILESSGRRLDLGSCTILYHMSYGLDLGWGGPIGGICRVFRVGLLRDILQT